MMEKFQAAVIVTGGTSGLGYEAASHIAEKRPSWLVVLAARHDNGAADRINHKLQQTNVQFAALDLASIEGVRAFVRSWAAEASSTCPQQQQQQQQQQRPPIKALLLNAILQSMSTLEYTEDGFERTFAISHVGHALLLALLGPHMADEARIVITGSGVHDPKQRWRVPEARYDTAELLARPPRKPTSSSSGSSSSSSSSSPPSGFAQYTATKLANVLWMYALDRRLRAAAAAAARGSRRRWTVTQMDPGMMPGTNLSRAAGPLAQWLFNHVLGNMLPLLRLLVHPRIFTPARGGRVLASLAVDAQHEGTSGAYFEDERRAIETSVDSYDEEKQEDLWRWTVKTLARDAREEELFECTFS